jgi:hypothetical protein
LAIFATILYIGGIALIVYFSHWAVGVGVFMVTWSRNIDKEIEKNKTVLERLLRRYNG